MRGDVEGDCMPGCHSRRCRRLSVWLCLSNPQCSAQSSRYNLTPPSSDLHGPVLPQPPPVFLSPETTFHVHPQPQPHHRHLHLQHHLHLTRSQRLTRSTTIGLS